MKLSKIIALVALVSLLGVALITPRIYASTSTLTGTIVDAQGNPLNGYITMQLPVPATDTTSNVNIPATPVTYSVVNGVIQSGPPLYDVADLSPSNLYYIGKIYNSAQQLIETGFFAVTGSSFNLGAAVPTAITTSNISYVNPVSASANNTFTGSNTFTQPITESVAAGTAPFSITSTTLVPNLNVNLLDGVTISGTAANGDTLVATSSTAASWQASSGGSYVGVTYSTPVAISADVAATTMTTTSSGTHSYRFSTYVDQTGVGVGCSSTSSVVVYLIWHDPAASTSVTETFNTWSLSGNGSLGTLGFLSGNSASPFAAAGSTLIQYSVTYTPDSACTTDPTFELYPFLEQLN